MRLDYPLRNWSPRVKGSKIRGSIKCTVIRKIKIKKAAHKLIDVNLTCLKIKNIIGIVPNKPKADIIDPIDVSIHVFGKRI